MLSDRRKRILQILIDDYIRSASPVSSKLICDQYVDKVSSATIRNELVVLEEMGYLTHPHTSAGRVPTNLAYKHYIDVMLHDSHLSKVELDIIKHKFNDHVRESEYIATNAVKIISDMTNYTSLATINTDKARIQSVRIVKLNDTALILIVISVTGEVNDFRIYGKFPEGEDYIKTAENVLNKYIDGKSIVEINIENVLDEVKIHFCKFKNLFTQIFDALLDRMGACDNLYLTGEQKIFEQPESSNVSSVKDFLGIVANKPTLRRLLNENDNSNGIRVITSTETNLLPDDISVVSCSYLVDNVNLGTYGVIGPTRMDYGKVIKVLNGMKDILADLINKSK